MEWTDTDRFEPTCELRRFGVGDLLQQRWRRLRLNAFGHVAGYDYEWRAVAHVYSEDRPDHSPPASKEGS